MVSSSLVRIFCSPCLIPVRIPFNAGEASFWIEPSSWTVAWIRLVISGKTTSLSTNSSRAKNVISLSSNHWKNWMISLVVDSTRPISAISLPFKVPPISRRFRWLRMDFSLGIGMPPFRRSTFLPSSVSFCKAVTFSGSVSGRNA